MRGGYAVEEAELQESIDRIDEAVGYLLAIVAGVFLSFQSVLLQRENLAQGASTSLYPLRATANSLIVGALGYFLQQTNAAPCPEDDPILQYSLHSNRLAALLVFCAAVIRLDDVYRLHRYGRL